MPKVEISRPRNMSSRQPTARAWHAAVGVGEKLFVWAGRYRSSCITTTTVESFNVPALTWEQPRQLNGSLPDGLGNAAVASDGENLYTFGGNTRSGVINTVYEINLRTLLCRELIADGDSFPPPEQEGSRSVYFKNKLVVYGGLTARGATDDLNVFNLDTRVWAVQPTTGKKPPPLYSHTFTKIDHHRAVVFGGYTGSSELKDTYVLDMDTWHWTKLKISGNKTPAKCSHAAWCITEKNRPILMVVGGYRGVPLGDVWLLDVDKGRWSKDALPGSITGIPRYGHSAVVFGSGPNLRVVVLFGGSIGQEVSDTTLLFLEPRGRSWQVTRVVKPDELERPDERLREQMRKLELPSQKELQTQSTATDGATSATAQNDTSSPTQTNEGRDGIKQNTATDVAAVMKVPTHTDESETKTSPIIDINELRLGKHLGKGGFGMVYEARWKTKVVAAKVCLGNLLKDLSREIQIFTSLPPHPNVLTFFGVALSGDGVSTYIITELAPNGSLHDYLHDKKEEPLPDQSLAWAQQIANGMQHLHNNNIVHRDLKSGNVLLALGLLAKICDFGTARTMAKTAYTTQKGTYRWMAPEVVEDIEANINKMCDVFSYGMVLYEIFDRKIPFSEIPGDAVAGVAVLQGKRPPIPANLPPYLCPLLEACWKKDPNQRPQFKEIVQAIQTQSF